MALIIFELPSFCHIHPDYPQDEGEFMGLDGIGIKKAPIMPFLRRLLFLLLFTVQWME